MADQLVADETGDRHDDDAGKGTPEEDVTLTTEIDLDFAPMPIDDVVVRTFGNEIILYHEEQEILFVLDPVGAMVWGFLDGEVTLRDIAADFVAELDAPAEQVETDVVDLAKRLGVMGLLKGVTTPSKLAEAEGTLEVGDELGAFSLPDMDGVETDITTLRGRSVLLVNWGPGCGFCLRIAPELAELAPKLMENDIELVLLSSGSVEDNNDVFDEHGLHVRTLLEPNMFVDDDHDHDHGDDDHEDLGEETGGAVARLDEEDDEDDDNDLLSGYSDPFPEMGTPVAYLLDADGRVAAPIAVGANAVPELARSLAGVVEEEQEVPEALPADAKFLSLADDGTCGPGATGPAKKPRVWAAAGAYTIGEYRVGVRPDSTGTDEILARFLAAHRLPAGTRVPEDYSIVIGDGGTTQRGLNLVLQGGTTVVRTRSPRRALMGLAAYLASHLRVDPTGLLRPSALGILVEGEAVILPEEVNGWLDDLQPRLARHGMALIDRSFLTVDVARREVVVDDPAEALGLDLSVLDELAEPPPRRSELPAVAPGRYPLRRWLIWASREDPPLTRAQLVTRALVPCLEAGRLDEEMQAIEDLREAGIVAPFDFMVIDELLDWLPDVVAGRPHAEPKPIQAPVPVAVESDAAEAVDASA